MANGPDEVSPTVPLRRRGPPRQSNPKSESVLRVRRHRDRQREKAIAVETATRAVVEIYKDVAPKGRLSKELLEYGQERAKETLKILIDNGPAIALAIVQRAIDGDPTAMSIAAKWLPNPANQTRITLPTGKTVEEAADHALGAAFSGSMSIEDAADALSLIRQHGDVVLSANLSARLNTINERLKNLSTSKPTGAASISARRAITLDAIDIDPLIREGSHE